MSGTKRFRQTNERHWLALECEKLRKEGRDCIIIWDDEETIHGINRITGTIWELGEGEEVRELVLRVRAERPVRTDEQVQVSVKYSYAGATAQGRKSLNKKEKELCALLVKGDFHQLYRMGEKKMQRRLDEIAFQYIRAEEIRQGLQYQATCYMAGVVRNMMKR